MKLEDIDNKLSEQTRRDPASLMPHGLGGGAGSAAPVSQAAGSAARSMQLPPQKSLSDIRAQIDRAYPQSVSTQLPSQKSLSDIRAQIDRAYPQSDFVRTGKREPTLGTVPSNMGPRQDPPFGKPGDLSRSVSMTQARNLPVPDTKQTVPAGSTSMRQMPGAGLPMPGTDAASKTSNANMIARSAGTGAGAALAYRVDQATTPVVLPPTPGTAATNITPPATVPPATAASAPSAGASAPASAPVPTPASTPDRAAPVTQPTSNATTPRNISNRVNQLASASNIPDPNKIQVGQKINLPGGGTYTVKAGDTLWGISKRNLSGNLEESQEILNLKRLSGI